MPKTDKNEDPMLKRRLLSSPPPPPDQVMTASVTIENEKMKKVEGSESAGDLRLHDAVSDQDFGEIESLLRTLPHLLFEKDDEGGTPLHILTISGDESAPEIARLLLNVGRDAVACKDDKGYSPLHYAARNWFPELVQVLLDFGAEPRAQDKKGDTPLHLAAEGNIERALDCVKILLQQDDETGGLINMKNMEEQTALHRAVKEQAGEMVKLLLSPEYHLNLSDTVDSSGQSIFHFLCVTPGETPRSCEILMRLLESCSSVQLNGVDKDNRTVLHISAIERLPKFVEILVQDKRMDVLREDKRKRTALHYAAENGSYPDGYACVEHLIGKEFPRTRTQIQYLYEMCDELGNSAFMYACLNCPVETLQKYLEAIREPQFWMSDTNMLLVYKQCPLAIKALMDRAFSERKRFKSSEKDVIVTDFGPITGYKDPIDELPQQETKYLKNALFWDYDTQKTILTHPLVQLFIVKKCQKLRAIIYGWILWQLIWLTAYTCMVLNSYCWENKYSALGIITSIVIVVYIAISLVNEVFEVVSVGWTYLRSPSNYLQLIQIVLATIAVSPALLGLDPSIVHKNCAATGILLAYILSMRDIGKMHEEIGLVVEVLKQVVIQIMKVITFCSPLLLGFTLAFVILFNDDESLNTAFPGPLVKVLVMMTGEFEYNDTFKSDGEEGKTMNEEAMKNRAIRLLLFLSFLICVPVAFFNLLTGFALERVMELRERAKVGRIAKQLEHIHFIESILLSLGPLKKVLPHDKLTRLLRKIDGDLKFETFLSEESRKKIDRRSMKERQMDICNTIRSIFGTQLPADVRREIFVLASKNN